MRNACAVALVIVMLTGCSGEQPQKPELSGKSDRVSEIENMLLAVVSQVSTDYDAGCYPPRPYLGVDMAQLSDMAMNAATLETQGYDISCVSFGGKGDSFGAVHPDQGLLFECPVGEGLVITMQRGSVTDGTADCVVVQ